VIYTNQYQYVGHDYIHEPDLTAELIYSGSLD